MECKTVFDGQELSVSLNRDYDFTGAGPGPVRDPDTGEEDFSSRVQPNVTALPRSDEEERLVEVFISPRAGAAPNEWPWVDGIETVAYDPATSMATLRLKPERLNTDDPEFPYVEDPGVAPGMHAVNGEPDGVLSKVVDGERRIMRRFP
ncbi:MAG: hypothetical protein M5U26_30270 [Planctomycetota bacterium]|nr:hypothetical protein [Planctomycetota bacterium]